MCVRHEPPKPQAQVCQEHNCLKFLLLISVCKPHFPSPVIKNPSLKSILGKPSLVQSLPLLWLLCWSKFHGFYSASGFSSQSYLQNPVSTKAHITPSGFQPEFLSSVARNLIPHGITGGCFRNYFVTLTSWLPWRIFSPLGHFSATFISLSIMVDHKKPLGALLLHLVVNDNLEAMTELGQIEQAAFSTLLVPHHCESTGIRGSDV